MEKHITLTYLLKITNNSNNGLENGELVGTVLIDLKKAFDTVYHDLLCKTLEHYGIQHQTLFWLQPYLSSRKHYCRVGGLGGGDSLTEKKQKSVYLIGHVLGRFSS